MPLTPEDVQNKRFSTVRFKEGYDEEEVDAFLDEVEAELRRLLAENEKARSAAPAAPAEPAPAEAAEPAEEPNEAALRTLLLAQRTADEAIAQARQEAEQIVASAKARAGSIESEAQAQHAASMAELVRQREAVQAEIDELRSFERNYRTRLKAYLESQLSDLEAKTIEPASLLTPGTPAAAPTPPAAVPPTGDIPLPVASSAAAPPSPASDIPRLAPPAGRSSSPFSPAPPLVEDVDAGSYAPTGPPREPAAEGDEESSAE